MVRPIANMLIGAGNGGGDYNVPVGETRSFQIEAPNNVLSAWYTPVDNLQDLPKFQTLSVAPASDNRVGLTVKPNDHALLRVVVFAEVE